MPPPPQSSPMKKAISREEMMRSPKKTGSLCHSLQSMTTPQRIDCSKIEWEQKDQKTNYITLTFHQGKMILGYTKKEKNHEREKEYSFSPLIKQQVTTSSKCKSMNPSDPFKTI